MASTTSLGKDWLNPSINITLLSQWDAHIRKIEMQIKIHNINIYIYIERERESWVQVTPDVTLSDITQLNNLLLDANFDKSTVGLHYIHILSMLAKKLHDYQKLIVMLSINCLNSSFCNLK